MRTGQLMTRLSGHVRASTLVVLLILITVAAAGPARAQRLESHAGHQAVAAGVAAQTVLLDPLRRLASGLDAQGRGHWAASYSGVALDPANDAVNLYATDTRAARAIVAAARRADPAAAWRSVHVRRATHSRIDLERQARRLLDAPAALNLTAVSVPVNGSALTVHVSRSTASMARLLRGTDIEVVPPVRQPAVAAPTFTPWAKVKWHDTAPFIGGDVLTRGSGYCTAGLPAVRRRDRHPLLVTAGHCFRIGQRVYTGGRTIGARRNGGVGAFVGTVRQRSTEWDAAVLDGADNNADESDTTGWKPLTSVGYSFVGDYVCHDGAASFFLHHPTPCGIKVTDGDIWFKIGGYWARGVEGVDVRTGWGSHNGDSGGTVFAVERGGVRQARGIISSGGADGTPDQKRVDWVEAPDIFAAFGLRLNSRT